MAEKNVILKQLNDAKEYDILYPKTIGEQIEGLTFDNIEGTLDGSRVSGSIQASQIEGNIPSDQVDAYTKAESLSDTTRGLYGLDTDSIPDSVLAWLGKYNLYWWKRKVAGSQPVSELVVEQTTINTGSLVPAADGVATTITVASSYKFDGNSITLVNPTTVRPSYASNSSAAANRIYSNFNAKYFESNGNIFYFNGSVPSNYVIKISNAYWGLSKYFSLLQRLWVKTTLPSEDWEYVYSSNRSAYPDSGEQNGFEYRFLGTPFNNMVEKPHIVIGQYAGTGTYGEDNPNTLSFDFAPSVVILLTQEQNSDKTNTADFIGPIFYPSKPYADGDMVVNFSGNELSWYNTRGANYQKNSTGFIYYYLALA